MTDKKIIRKIYIKIRGEVYQRVYTRKDIENIIVLFNDINSDGMHLQIEDVQVEEQ